MEECESIKTLHRLRSALASENCLGRASNSFSGSWNFLGNPKAGVLNSQKELLK